MSEKATKITIITLLALVFFSAVGLVYYFLFGGSPATTTPATTTSNGIFPTATPNQPTPQGGSTGTSGGGTGGGRIYGGGTAQTPIDRMAGTAGGTTVLNTRKLTESPTTLPTFIARQDPNTKTNTLFVRYEERGTGHIYELRADQSGTKKISDTTLTKTYETLWGQGGKTLIIRKVGDSGTIENIYGFIEEAFAGSTTVSSMIGSISPIKITGDIKALAVSPDQIKFFYLSKVSGDVIGYTSDFTGTTLPTKKTQVFSSPVGSWNASWPNANTIILSTKPSGKIPGSIFLLNLKTGGFEKVLGGINGLTALVSPDAKQILYTASSGNGISTYIYNISTNISTLLPIKTLTDKCVWSLSDPNLVYCAIPTEIVSGNYPDDWYQGRVSLTDEIWKIDVKTPRTDLVAAKNLFAKEGGTDVSGLVLSPDEDYLAFTNKRDSTPWLIKIN